MRLPPAAITHPDDLAGLVDHLRTIAARLGGDEFACLTVGTSAEALDALAARMPEVVCVPVAVGVDEARVACGIGIATAASGDDPVRLFDAADRAMYGVKARGKCGFAHA